MTDALDVPPVTAAGLDASCILGTDDTSLARPGNEFAARLGNEPHMVPGGHMGPAEPSRGHRDRPARTALTCFSPGLMSERKPCRTHLAPRLTLH